MKRDQFASIDKIKSWSAAREYLRHVREKQIHRSDEIVKLYTTYIESSATSLGDEQWNVYEQVCIAALDCDEFELAADCLDALADRFPDSTRVKRLFAMQLEADGEYAKATELYEQLLAADDTEAIARKRLVAVLKAQRRYTDAITKLNDYLRTFQADQEAWLELSDLYCHERDYSRAAFCAEELLLLNPHHHLYHQRYAEIRYAEGGMESVEAARTHFSQAAKLSKRNYGALYGVVVCCAQLVASQKLTTARRRDNAEIGMWSAKQLLEQHRGRLAAEQVHRVEQIDLALTEFFIAST